ncbi:MAG: ornithine cyclodeaminase family protein [Pseudomonadota bacterium]|jgi:ornithine cyclodeaminase/alanine dehydrogenase-like protein (mu-crystallin family)|nr:ornithine cyclodeaminase family protein [Rubrivivax sp.]MCA3258485.1 ornithine cyclodeaminase family protein [Rubrivivax sp.]MCZ8031565.1 ornithine cyclodeaminase family protein [Rubrivivax sp.]
MQIFDAEATRAALPLDRLVPALRDIFAEGAEVPRRHVHELAVPGAQAVTSLLMPAWQPGGLYAVKVVNVATGNAARGLPGVHASVLLHDASTGRPLALLDGDVITARRTAAASALAASFLARADARRLLVVGAGRVAALLPAAHRTVRPIGPVEVWARRPGAAAALARTLRDEGFDAVPTADLAAACARADIVSCATLASEPLVRGRWLAPGSHLDLIGSFTPAMREADDDCLRGAALYADTDEALAKSGDLAGPLERGVIGPADLRGTLAALCRGEAPGRRDAVGRTVFKSVGNAIEDLAAAALVWRAAQPPAGQPALRRAPA